MRTTMSNSTREGTGVDGGFRHWNSPIPYLFGGLAVMLGLIALALVILACSYRKSPANDSSISEGEDQKQTKKVNDTKAADLEPKIVVVMAGDDNPTYLAKPVNFTTFSIQHV